MNHQHLPVTLTLVAAGHKKSPEFFCGLLAMGEIGWDMHKYARDLLRRGSVESTSSSKTVVKCDRTLQHKPSDSSGSTSVPAEPEGGIEANLVQMSDMKGIQDGTEHRTTLMVKKVPRKYVHDFFIRTCPPRYTLNTLRYEIESVLGEKNCYDLLYLPVDSAKMTNRGYAFINFKSPRHVGVFVREFLDRPWSEMNRKSKAAALYWAYVQGKEETLAHINTGVA